MKFEELLVAITVITGLVWLMDSYLLKPSREASWHGNHKESIIVEYSKAFFPVLLIVLILRSFVAEPFKIPSGSMQPSLIEGDHILVNKFTYGLRLPIIGFKLFENNKPKRGDVIVFRHVDHKDLIKRIVGLPGDHISYRGKLLYINDIPVHLTGKDMVKIADLIAYKQIETLENKELENKDSKKSDFAIEHSIITDPTHDSHSYPYDDFNVPENSYFVMGDNRDNSHDSRYWGVVNDSAIIGRAFAIWWSWDVTTWSDFTQFWHIKVYWDRVGTAIK